MKSYIGAKIVQAEPIGPHGMHSEPGYRVVYQDGYTSWSPAAAFEEAYRETSGMPFGLAIEALKKGHRVARAGWNGKGMYLAHIPGGITEQPNVNGGRAIEALPWIGMKTADDKFVPWLASQTDMLSDDWQIVE